MSSKPVPIISEAPVFELTDLPIATVTLSGAASEPSTGATSIVGWLWTLHSKPPGSNATLFNAETPEVQILNIDQSGSYLVSLQVVDDLGRSSHSGIEPTQSTSAPFAFSFPVASSMAAVRVKSLSGLTKVAYGERQWLEHGLWPLIDRIDQNSSAIDSISSLGNGQIYADDIYEFTTGHEIHVHHRVRVDQIRNRTKNMSIQAVGPTDTLSVSAGKTLFLSAGDAINVSTASGDINLISSSAAIVEASTLASIATQQAFIQLNGFGDIISSTSGEDSYFQVNFTGSNVGKRISLNGCVSSFNNKYSKFLEPDTTFYNIGPLVEHPPESPFPAPTREPPVIIPYQTEQSGSWVFPCKMLSTSNSNLTPNFSLSVKAGFLLKAFVPVSERHASIFLNIVKAGSGLNPVSLLELKFQPENYNPSTDFNYIEMPISAEVTITPSGNNLVAFGSASLQFSQQKFATATGYGTGYPPDGFWNFSSGYYFIFSGASNTYGCLIRNVSASMQLQRGS